MRVGSVIDCWPMIRNGVAGTSPRASAELDSVSASTLSATCSVPARRAGSADHGIGRSRFQSTFTVALSHSKRPHVVEQLRGQVLGAHEIEVERRRADVGEHRPRRPHFVAARAHRDRAPIADHDAIDGRVAHDLATPRAEARHERGGELAGTTFGNRPADALGRARTAPTRRSRRAPPPARGRRAAPHPASSRRARVGAELLLAHPPHREQREPRDARPAVGPRASTASRALAAIGGVGVNSAASSGSRNRLHRS